MSDSSAFQLSLVENLQREDLNPIEETEGILELLCMELEKESSEVVSLLYRMQNLRHGKITEASNSDLDNKQSTDNVISNSDREQESITEASRSDLAQKTTTEASNSDLDNKQSTDNVICNESLDLLQKSDRGGDRCRQFIVVYASY